MLLIDWLESLARITTSVTLKNCVFLIHTAGWITLNDLLASGGSSNELNALADELCNGHIDSLVEEINNFFATVASDNNYNHWVIITLTISLLMIIVLTLQLHHLKFCQSCLKLLLINLLALIPCQTGYSKKWLLSSRVQFVLYLTPPSAKASVLLSGSRQMLFLYLGHILQNLCKMISDQSRLHQLL